MTNKRKYFHKVNFEYGFGQLGLGGYVYQYFSNKILLFIPEKELEQ